MKRTFWLLAAVAFVAVLFQPAPAQAAWPEGYSMVFFDVTGSLMECVDLGRCGSDNLMPATAFLAGRFGSCECPDEFEPGRHHVNSCTWNDIDWSFFAPNTKQVQIDLNCSRWGFPFFFFIAQPTGSCGGAVTYRRIDQFGASVTLNEGYSGATVGRPFSCANVFGAMTAGDIEDLDIRNQLKRNR